MAINTSGGGDHRPDQAQWTRMQMGMASPLWLPFMVAASAGAAWWTYANFARLAAGGGMARALTPNGGNGASVKAPAAAQPAPAARPQPETPRSVQPAPREHLDLSPEPPIMPPPLPEPEPAPILEVEAGRRQDLALTPGPAAPPPAKPTSRRKAVLSGAVAGRVAKPEDASPKPRRKAAVAEPVGEDLIDAAYAANLGPVPAPKAKSKDAKGAKGKKKG